MEENSYKFYEQITRRDEVFPILDSKLITGTNLKMYNTKLVDCGDYIQVYVYENSKFLSNKEDKVDLELKKQKIYKLFELNKKNELKSETLREQKIEDRNIIRSKLTCQRIAKANYKIWETFITLTFAENEQDIKKANNKFHNFIRQVRRVKKDFSYISIPEFQKRGAIHYHLLTNINIKDKNLIYDQEDNPKFKHIKYWKNGFTSVEIMKGDIKKIVGYISKYMTKNIDNRLFGFRRFLYSQNLTTPKENYLNIRSENELNFFNKKIQDKELVYQNEYINPHDNSKVLFLEFLNEK